MSRLELEASHLLGRGSMIFAALGLEFSSGGFLDLLGLRLPGSEGLEFKA